MSSERHRFVLFQTALGNKSIHPKEQRTLINTVICLTMNCKYLHQTIEKQKQNTEIEIKLVV